MSQGTLLAGIGAAAGSAIPGVGLGLGLQIGAALGSVLEPTPSQERGKVSDLRFSGSSLDVPIPRVWGAGGVRVGGNVVWMAKNPKTKGYFFERKKSSRVGGSRSQPGAPVTEYRYLASPLFLLAVGTLWFPEEDATLWRQPYVAEAYFGTELVYRQDAAGNVGLNKHNAVVLRGTDMQTAPSLIVASGGRGAQTPALRGSIGMLFPDLNVTPFGNALPQMSAVIKTAPVTVGDVLSDLARLSGMPLAWIDFSDADMPLTGFAWLERAAPRTAMETLCRAYALDLVEAGGKLYARKRYAAKVPFGIPPGWIGAGDGGAAAAPVTRTSAYERDLPARVSVGFYDSGSLYERSVAEDVRQTGDTARDASFPTGLTLTAAQAREIAARESDEAWAAREAVELPLPLGALILEPGDLLTLPDEGEDLVVRVETMTCEPLGIVKVSGRRFDLESGARPVLGGAGGNAESDPVVASPSVFTAFSGREVVPEHQISPGFYVAAGGDDDWRGGTCWYLPPGATEWLKGPDLTSRATFGVTGASLASGATGQLDAAHSVWVDVSASYGDLSSVEDAALRTGENLAWIGEEILAFGIADPVLAHVYDLSRVLRGLQGSAPLSHAPGERFVLAEDGAVARVDVPEAHVGLVYGVKVLSPGQSLADVAAKSVTIMARNRTATELAFDEVTRTVLPSAAVTVTSVQRGYDWQTFPLGSAPAGTRMAFVKAEVADGGGSGSAKILARDAAGGAETIVAAARLYSGNVSFSDGAWVRVGGAAGAYTIDLRSEVGFDTRQIVRVVAWAVADLAGSASGIGGSPGTTGSPGPIGPPGPGVPPGGAPGEILKKLSAADFDAEWGDAPGGIVVPGADGQALVNSGGALGALPNVVRNAETGFLDNRVGGSAVLSQTSMGSLVVRANNWSAVLRTTSAEAPGSFVDVTRFANEGDMTMFGTGAVGDRMYWGADRPVVFMGWLGKVGGEGGAASFEYWNGSAWVQPQVGFNLFTGNGGAERIFDSAWSRKAINGRSLYWIRATVTTAYSTRPQGHFNVNSGVGVNRYREPSNVMLLLQNAGSPLTLDTMPENGSAIHAILPYDWMGAGITMYTEGRGITLSIGAEGSFTAPNANQWFNSVKLSGFAIGNQSALHLGYHDLGHSGGFAGISETLVSSNAPPDWTGNWFRFQLGGVDRFTLKPGVLTMGRVGTAAGTLRMEIGQGGKYAGFRAAQSQIASANVWTLPTMLGTSGQLMATSDEAGTLAMTTGGAAGQALRRNATNTAPVWGDVRELPAPTTSDAYKVPAVNLAGTGYDLRLPDVRMLVVRAAVVNYPIGTQNSNSADLPTVFAITLPAGTLVNDAMCFVTQVETWKRSNVSMETALTFAGVTFGNFPIDSNGAAKSHTTDVEIIRIGATTGRIVVRRTNQTTSIVHTFVNLTNVDWSQTQTLTWKGASNTAVGSENQVLSVTSYIRNAGAASLLTVGSSSSTPGGSTPGSGTQA